jgi:hypothetical protein
MSTSTVFSRSSRKADRKSSRRSESVAAIERVARSRREPIADYNSDHDVATLICTELSRAILLEPNVNLGSFFKVANDSRRDINKSDSTVLVTAAILATIGNKNMSKQLLNKSMTLTKIYEKMNLHSDEIRDTLVTMLFALSPTFVEMIEKVIKMAINRSADRGVPMKDVDPLYTALARLAIDRTISPVEMRRASSFDADKDPTLRLESKRTSITKTPVAMIGPADFELMAREARAERHRINEKDLRDYAVRRKSGTEIEFEETFRSADAPVAIANSRRTRRMGDRRGLGYTEQASKASEHIAAMNKILGSHTTKSIDITTGEVNYRRPQVTDYLDSESVSGSIFNAPPDVRSEYESTPDTRQAVRPLPTEYYLPSEADTIVPNSGSNIRRVDSFEELLRKNGFT